MAGVGEHRQQVRRGEEAGAEVGAGLSDQLDEARRGRVAQLVGDQPERQRAHVVGLRVRRQAPFGVDVFGSPRIARRASRGLRSALPSSVVPEQPADPRHQRGGVVEERGRHVALIGLPARRRPARATRPSGSPCPTGTPRAVPGSGRAVTRCRRNGSTRCVRGVLHPSHHRRPELGEHAVVAVDPRHRPRDHDDGVAPSGRALEAVVHTAGRRPRQVRIRARSSRTLAVGALLGREVAEPLRARSRRRRRGTPRSGGTPASRRSTPPARAGDSRSGSSHALPRKLQSAISWKRLMRSSLHRNQPVRRRSVCTTTPVTSSGVSRCGCPSTLHVLEAVRRVSRFEHVAVATGRDHVVDLADRQRAAVGVVATGEMVLRDVPAGVERLAVHERQLGARPARGRSVAPSR